MVTPGLIISQEFPWLGFSPDGVIFEENIPVKLVEIKCPYIGIYHFVLQHLFSAKYFFLASKKKQNI